MANEKKQSYESINLKWFRPFIGYGKTFNAKDVARIIAVIVGSENNKDYMCRAMSLIRDSYHNKTIFIHHDNKDFKKIAFCFEKRLTNG